MSKEKIVDLESRLAFQESLLQDLNDVMADQQQQIMLLREQVAALFSRIEAMAEPTVRDPADETPPPHY